MLFTDRKEAGRVLGEYVKQKVREVDLVLGIPRGGVLVAKEVARALGVPMSLLIVRKLGVPLNPELAFGAIDPEGKLYLDHPTVRYFRLSPEDIQKIAREEFRKIKEKEKRFLGGSPPQVENKVVILVDDGVATGQTMVAGIEYLKRKGARRVIVAVPVCHKESMDRLCNYADEVYCYHVSEDSPFAVGMFYREFGQVEDREVEELLHSPP